MGRAEIDDPRAYGEVVFASFSEKMALRFQNGQNGHEWPGRECSIGRTKQEQKRKDLTGHFLLSYFKIFFLSS
jgi:hypothetical protein